MEAASGGYHEVGKVLIDCVSGTYCEYVHVYHDKGVSTQLSCTQIFILCIYIFIKCACMYVCIEFKVSCLLFNAGS